MEKEDIEEFREAIQRMSDEDSEGKKQSAHDESREKLLEEYKQEATQLEKENEAIKLENSRLCNTANRREGNENGCVKNEVLIIETQTNNEKEIIPDNDQDDDDLSSIFSEDEDDLRSLVEGSDTIRKALKNLRKERDFWIADTESETSDDGDTSVSARSLRESSIDRIQISKLLAEKEFLELKLSQVTNEKKETETKLRFMEKSDLKRRQESTRLNQSDVIPRIESKAQSSIPGDNKKQREALKTQPHRQKHKGHIGNGMSNTEFLQFLKSRSISPQLVKGYEDDIAILAEENAKLGEIIDHLHINPEDEQSPRIDPMAAFMDAYEHRVPQEDYMRLESEKMRLEHLVKEKDRQIKERDRIIEETKFEFEDEVKHLKESLRRTEEKMREKAKQLNEYEIQIIEMKSSFEDQMGNAENEIQIGNEQKLRLEEINGEFMERNKKCQIEIENLKASLSKLSAREKEIEKKYKHELKLLEEKYLTENQEKTQLSGNLEGLMSDLMVLKNKLLEDGSKTARMRENFEKERQNMSGEALDVDPRFANLTLHLKSRGHGETGQQPLAGPTEANQLNVAMDSSDINLSMQPDVSGYTMLIQEQKEKIEMLEKANQELNAKLLGFMQQQNEQPNVQSGSQLGVPVFSQNEVQQNSQDANNNTSRPSSAMKFEMNELEQENNYLKNKLDDLGKEKMKRRELEEKNEELQEEITQMSKKRNELQKKQEAMSSEIEEMNEKVEELEKCNVKLTKEADQLTNKIRDMEESFNEEKERLTITFDKAFEKERDKMNEMEEEIERLQNEINLLTNENKELKNKYNVEMRKGGINENQEIEEEMERMRDEIASLEKQNKDIKSKYNKEIENLKRKHEDEMESLTQLEGDNQQNLEKLKKVEAQWKLKLQHSIKKYEDQLKTSEEERKKLLLRLKTTAKDADIVEGPESALLFDSQCPLEMANHPNDDGNVDMARVLKTDDYIPNMEQDDTEPLGPSITEAPLDDHLDSNKTLDTRIDSSPLPIHNRRVVDNDEVEVEYSSIVPNLQIQVELENADDRERVGMESSRGNKQLEEQMIKLQNSLNQKQNEILRLTQKIGQLEQQLIAKNGEIALIKEREKNASVVFQTKMDDKTKYYQDLLENLKTTLQGEKKELEERLNKDSEEMQRLMKEEFQKSLASKSGVLENKLQDLVAEKVKAYKEQIKKLDAQLQDAREKIKQFEKGEDERTKKLEREKKVLRATIQALSKELSKEKQERKELKKEYKKGKAELKNAANEERKSYEESLERAKEVQKLKIEEEMRNKYSVDVEKYEEKVEKLSEEIQQYETKLEDMVIKFKEEKFKLESDLQDSLVELESVKESQKEFKTSLEEEYKRKLRKEKQNIETTLENLRQEIARLRENRQHLETQLQQNAQYKLEKDSGHTTTHTAENMFNNKEIFNRIENEYQQQLQREKEYYESKIRDLEDDYENLNTEISRMKAKFRQERSLMKSEFEKEKSFLEERFEREKREMQASMQFRMHNMRDPRMTQPMSRNINAAQRNIRLQNELDMLQHKVSRLEDLSPRLIDMAQRTPYTGMDSNTRYQSSHQINNLQVPQIARPAMHPGPQYQMTNDMANSSRDQNASPHYREMSVSGNSQEFISNASHHGNEVMVDNDGTVRNSSYEGGYTEEISNDRGGSREELNVNDITCSIDNDASHT